MLHPLCTWIDSALAAYFEDLADAARGVHFVRIESIVLGLHASSVMANIVENYLKLSPEEREQVISDLQSRAPEPEFVPTLKSFTPSAT